MNTPSVSVILPVYNAGKYIARCLDSICSQTLRNIEIICIDDGSTDESANILDDYARRDGRIRVLHQANQGAGPARNAGMALATGTYLSFLDADDFFVPDMLEETYATSVQGNADICVFGCDQYDDTNNRYLSFAWSIRKKWLPTAYPFAAKDVPDTILNLFNGWAWDKLFKKDYIDRLGITFQNLRTTNDAYFVWMALAYASAIFVLPKAYVHRRINVGTSLSMTREKSWDCILTALYACKASLEQGGLYETYRCSYVNLALELVMWNLNTLKEPAREQLFDRLRADGFSMLGIAGQPKAIFYNKHEYEEYQKIMKAPAYHAYPQKSWFVRSVHNLADIYRKDGLSSVIIRFTNRIRST